MKAKSDVTIIGGGLAGLTSAIHLSKSGLKNTSILYLFINQYKKLKI